MCAFPCFAFIYFVFSSGYSSLFFIFHYFDVSKRKENGNSTLITEFFLKRTTLKRKMNK